MFMKKLSLYLEFIGYSRAIGAMIGQPGVTADHVVGLYRARAEVKSKLDALKAEIRDERFGKALYNA